MVSTLSVQMAAAYAYPGNKKVLIANLSAVLKDPSGKGLLSCGYSPQAAFSTSWLISCQCGRRETFELSPAQETGMVSVAFEGGGRSKNLRLKGGLKLLQLQSTREFDRGRSGVNPHYPIR